MITGRHIRMARAALGWKVSTLGDKADISWARLQHMERLDDIPDSKPETLARLKKVLEDAGIAFLPETETDGPGVRLSKTQSGS